MYNPSLLGFEKGPAYIKSKQEKINDYWTLLNIPNDIPKKTALNNVKRFLSEIVALEIPTSLMCNCDCTYCYIREKWLKNTVVSLDIIKKVVEASWEHILEFENNSKIRIISAWGAEPFCNLDTLEYVVDFCKEHNATTHLSTNATILNDRVKKLIHNMYEHYVISLNNSLGVPSFQISLDGPKNIQDKYRPMYSGQSNYDNVMKFINFMNDLSKELNIPQKLYGLCSTIYLGDGSINNYKDSIDFFTDPTNENVYSSHLPIRIENSKNFTKNDSELFYEMIRESTELIIKKSKATGRGYLDHYASKLFTTTCRVDGWPRCSAMNTQLGIDIDGSMYMCHGPITTTNLKPFHWFGNVLEGVIDYRRYISVMDRMYADTAFRAICKTCELGINCSGSLCNSCPPIADSSNYEPVNFNIHMCNIYKKCLPLWKKQYDQYQNSIQEDIPRWKV